MPPNETQKNDIPDVHPVIYSVGDVHGHLDQFLVVIQQARQFHHKEYRGRPAWLVTLGDHIDRGPQSAHLIDLFIVGHAPIDWFERRIHLRGNHEQMMLDALRNTHPYDFERWGWNGGKETMASYNAEWPDPDDPDFNSADPLHEIRDCVPATHIAWMEGLPYTFDYENLLFVHAGINPGVPLEDQKTKDFLWIRETFIMHEGGHPYRVIHGHTPEDFTPTLGRDRVCLDTGVYEPGGRLTCAVFDPQNPNQFRPHFFQADGPVP